MARKTSGRYPIWFSEHGWTRKDARRIPLRGIEIVLEYGRCFRSYGRLMYRLDRRVIRSARMRGLRLDIYEGITLCVDAGDGRIVTAYRDRRGRRVWR
jgi:hypothetical protein